MSSVTVPKGFQQDSITSAVKVLSSCLTDIDKIKGTAQGKTGRALIVSNRGTLLFEAPTGTGKTLMAGNTVEQLSIKHKIVWFWFAPFSGIIDQTARSITSEFRNLFVKDPSKDRHIGLIRSGDVFVTTWQSVAVAKTESRKIRQESEEFLSIDVMIQGLKYAGFSIGVVIDEAHHTFRGQTQAYSFYRDILDPDITILVTATPRDRDIDEFIKKNGIVHLNRISVSRAKGVEAGLIKKGVKVAVFRVPSGGVEELINFKQTALKCGVATHKKLREKLANVAAPVTPLLLVQVDSLPNSIQTAVKWLNELGFSGDQVRIHTAAEPDPQLFALANDERVEVLVFKMAVATGFDAPRAFTLVSMRTARDPDFGTQIVGRIMRVDRRLQGLKRLDEPLEYGYVFLSDNESQTGLTSAAQRINSIKDELADITDNIAVVTIGDETQAQATAKKGQTILFPSKQKTGEESGQVSNRNIGLFTLNAEQQVINGFELSDVYVRKLEDSGYATSQQEGFITAIKQVINHYPLRDDLQFPRRFRRAKISPDQTNLLAEVISLFKFDNELIQVAQQSATKIIVDRIEVFAGKRDRPEELQATLAQKEIDKHAQMTLRFANEDGLLDIRALHQALEKQLEIEFGNRGLAHLQTREHLRNGVNKILALRPAALKDAIIEATKRHVELEETESLPEELISGAELEPSRLNIYGVYPEGLNSWERAFARELDLDITGTIQWWHRNHPRKPYSIGIPLPSQIRQENFFPDFAVGVGGRSRGEGIILVETKRILNDEEGNAQAKAQIEHPSYKRVMMVYWEGQARWMVVMYDPTQDRCVLDRVWNAGLMVGW